MALEFTEDAATPRFPWDTDAVVEPVLLAAGEVLVAEFMAVVLPPVAELVLVVELELPRLSVNVLLMLINCSRLLTCTNWFTYAFGSDVLVGS